MSSQRGTIGLVLWFWVLVLVVLIGAIAVVAAGRGDSMVDVYDDRPDAGLPTGRPLTADDLRSVRLNTGVRGYRMDEVDALLSRLQAEMISREDEVRVLDHAEDSTLAEGTASEESPPEKSAPGESPPEESAPGESAPGESEVEERATFAEPPHVLDRDQP